jgi:hypothetical protein
MSMPTSRMASTADGLTSVPGSDPPDHATARPPARWLSQPSAICDRPDLCTHRKSTVGSAARWSGPSESRSGMATPL